MSKRQVRLGVHFPGVNSTTVWSDPASGSQIDFQSFRHLAQVAEANLLDFFFLAEGLRLREHKGEIFDLDVVGRPDTLTVLSALAAVTEHLGLAGTINTTFNEPFDLARQFASLDYLSGGRAAWNVVTSSDAFTGENFRRGGYLPHQDRYLRAAEVVEAARELWSAWPTGTTQTRRVVRQDTYATISGYPTVPATTESGPVIFQAGDSPAGRDFAAQYADVIFSLHTGFDAARAFYDDAKSRLAAFGREPDSLAILPATSVVLGDSGAEAEEKAAYIRRQQVSGPGAIAFLEQVWGVDLTSYDPEGPLPDIAPNHDGASVTRGRVRHVTDPTELVRSWRELAELHGWSIRDLVIAVTSRNQFTGTAQSVAAEIDHYVQERATDGFILVPHLTPHGLDDTLTQLVPLLQERGSFRTQYTGNSLRENLNLPARPLNARPQAAEPQTVASRPAPTKQQVEVR